MSPAKRRLAWRADYSEFSQLSGGGLRHTVQMLKVLPAARNAGVIAVGLVPMAFAAYRWARYFTLPRPIFIGCGNCWLGYVGIPLEFGLLGAILVSRSLQRADLLQGDGVWWFGAVCGILATPFIVGVPLYLASLVMLVWPD